MKNWLLSCVMLLLSVGLWAQEGPGEPLAIEKQVESLSQSNNALQKELEKLKGKIDKLLGDKLQSLSPGQLDTLLNFQMPRLSLDTLNGLTNSLRMPELNGLDVSQIGALGKADSISNKLSTASLDPSKLGLDAQMTEKLEKYLGISLKPDFLDSLQGLVPGGQLAKLNELQSDLLAKTKLTPPNLDIANDLQVSIKEVDELKQLLAKLQLPSLNTPDFQNQLGENILPKGRFDRLMKRGDALKSALEEYTKEFENWDQKLLERVTSLEEVALIQKQKDRIDNYEFLPEGYRKNLEGMQTNDFVKDKLQAKADELKRAGAKSMQEKFDEAQSKIAEAKEKFPSLESVKDAPKRPPNPYKDEPFLKRLKFGFNFQVNRQEPISTDLAINVSYLLNQNARLGIGGSYRIGLEKDFGGINFDDQVYGVRSFFDYTIFRSIYAEALYEWSNTEVGEQQQPSDAPISKKWVQSGMIGLGNRFTIKKKLNGNFTALYNFLHNTDSPNPSPWVFRFGFEF